MAMDLGKALLELDYNKDIRAQQKWAQKESSASGLGGGIGGLLGGALPALLLSSALGPVGMALAVGAGAGLGSFAGSKAGGAFVPDIDTKFGQQSLIDLEDEIKDKQLADAISAAGTGATMSYMGGLGAGGKLTPAQQSIVDESVLGATDVTMSGAPDLSGVTDLSLLDKQLLYTTSPPGSAGYEDLVSRYPGGEIPGETIQLGDTGWDYDFIKEYQDLAQQDVINAQTGNMTVGAPEYFQQQVPTGPEYLSQVEKAQTAWQQQGGDAAFDVFDPGYDPTGPYKKGMGLYTDTGENLLDLGQSWDKMKGFGGQGMDWMKQHPYMSAGLGGGGLLALLMMMNQGRK